MSEKLEKLRAMLEKEKDRRIKLNNRIEILERRIQQKNKKQAEKEAIDPDADYTEDKGSFEIPPEDDSDENTSEEQDVTPI